MAAANVVQLHEAIKVGDMDAFSSLYPTIKEQLAINVAAAAAAKFGQMAMLGTILSNPDVDWSDRLVRYRLLVLAATSPADNREVLEFLWQNYRAQGVPFEKYYTDLVRQQDVHIAGVRFFLGLPEANLGVVRTNLPYVAGSGRVELFRELISVSQPCKYVLKDCVLSAALAGDCKMMTVLREYVPFDEDLVLSLLHESMTTSAENFGYVLSLPEVDSCAIQNFLERHVREYLPNFVSSAIAESGKMCQLELRKLLDGLKQERAAIEAQEATEDADPTYRWHGKGY